LSTPSSINSTIPDPIKLPSETQERENHPPSNKENQLQHTTMRAMLFGCFAPRGAVVDPAAVGNDDGTTPAAAKKSPCTKTKPKKRSMRRVQSSTARLRTLPVDDLSRTLASSGMHAFTYAELRLATRNFAATNKVGEGGFGPVYKGFLDDRIVPGIEPQHVAVKALDADGPQGHREWLAEVVYLGMQLNHPHLVKLVGYCIEDHHRMLVYEFMARRSLEDHLFQSTNFYSFDRVLVPWFNHD
jgi:hypothetical protein